MTVAHRYLRFGTAPTKELQSICLSIRTSKNCRCPSRIEGIPQGCACRLFTLWMGNSIAGRGSEESMLGREVGGQHIRIKQWEQ